MVLVNLRSLLNTLPGRLLFYLTPLSIINWRFNGYHLRQDREFVNAKDVLITTVCNIPDSKPLTTIVELCFKSHKRQGPPQKFVYKNHSI